MSRSSRPTGTTRIGAADEVDHGRSPLRVACGRDRAARLVEEDVAERLLADETAVDADVVGAPDERVELARLAVDGDAPGLDEPVRAATRGDAGAREVGVQAHAVHSVRVRSRVVRDIADLTRRFADLIVGFGANVQPGQIVGITTNPGKEELTRQVARAAYERGARWVDVFTHDPWVKRQRLAHADETTLEFVPPWMVDRLEWFSDERAARITLSGNAAPEALDGIDPARAGQGRPAVPPERRRRHQPGDDELVRRAGAHTAAGRGSSTRTLDEAEAYERLWDAIAHVCRLDEDDPEAAWRERGGTLRDVATRLTERRFDSMRLHGPGTDVTVGLMASSVWLAADFETVGGIRHYPNVPSEEIFTTPDPLRVDGHVTATQAARGLRRHDRRDPRRVRGRARRQDRRRSRRRRAACAGGEGRRRLAARRARARRRRGPDRPARHGLLRDAPRRERREPHRARERLRSSAWPTRPTGSGSTRAASTSTS